MRRLDSLRDVFHAQTGQFTLRLPENNVENQRHH